MSCLFFDWDKAAELINTFEYPVEACVGFEEKFSETMGLIFNTDSVAIKWRPKKYHWLYHWLSSGYMTPSVLIHCPKTKDTISEECFITGEEFIDRGWMTISDWPKSALEILKRKHKTGQAKIEDIISKEDRMLVDKVLESILLG